MKKYYFTITSLLVLVICLASCSKEETKTQNNTASRPIVPILDRTVTDVDGNIYKIVTIGNKKWTKTNLNVSHYRNGDPIPQVTDPTQWGNLTTGAWCYYNNDSANGPIYGKLYNWYAINDPRGLAPIGYHVQSEEEWTSLITFLGGISIAGGKLKAMALWNSPNTGATNSSSFTGLPGGCRNTNGEFSYIGSYGFWWCSNEYDTTYAPYYFISCINIDVNGGGSVKSPGFSVRCIKD